MKQDWLWEKIHENTALCCCSKRCQTQIPLPFFFFFCILYPWCSCHAFVVHLIVLGLFPLIFTHCHFNVAVNWQAVAKLCCQVIARNLFRASCQLQIWSWVWRRLFMLSCVNSFARFAGKLPSSCILQAVLCHLPASITTMH